MKAKKYVIGGILVVLLCAAGYWFWRTFMSDSYLDVLPSRPKALAAVDLSVLSADAGVEVEDVGKILPAEWVTARSGIDWSQKIYAFVSAKEYVGLLLPVKDAGELEDFFRSRAEKGFCTQPEERFSCHWSVVDGKWLAGFDGKALLMMGPGLAADMDRLRQEMVGCFRQKRQVSGASTALFADVNRNQAAVSVAVQLDLLPSLYDSAVKMSLPEHADLSDVSLLADLHFTEKGLRMDAELHSANAAVVRYYEQLFRSTGTIDGQLAGYVPEDALFWACAHVNGEELLRYLRRNPALRTFLMGLNLGVDADLMIRSIDGDVAFMQESPVMNGKNFLLTAQLKNTDFLSEADYWEKSAAANGAMAFRNFGNDRFFISYGDMRFYFGVKGKTLYVTPSEELGEAACRAATDVMSPWTDRMKEGPLFVWVNLRRLKEMAAVSGMMQDMDSDGLQKGLDLFDDLVLCVSDSNRITLEMRTQGGRNVLKELLKEWKQSN